MAPVDQIREQRHAAYLLALRDVLDTKPGRRVLYRAIWELGQLEGRRFAVEPDPVKDGMSAAMHDARFDGRRMVAETLAAECEAAAPDLFDLMNEERRDEARRTHARLRDAQEST